MGVGVDPCAVDCFNTATAAWESVPSVPRRRVAPSVASLGGYIYMVGGACDDGDPWPVDMPTNTAWRMNFSRRIEWEALDPMEDGRTGAAAAALGHFLYVCGGNGVYGEPLKSAERFDTSLCEWETLNDLASPRAFSSAVVLRERLYVCGGVGRKEGHHPRVLERLDPPRSSRPKSGSRAATANGLRLWRQLPKMSQGRAGAAVVAHGLHLYVCGGCRGATYLAASESFDVVDLEWRQLPPMRHRRADAAVTIAAGGLVICGGEDGGEVLRAVERLDLSAADNGWESLPSLSLCRAGASVAASASGLHVFGGFDGGSLLSSGERLALVQGARWEALLPMPGGSRAGVPALTAASHLYEK